MGNSFVCFMRWLWRLLFSLVLLTVLSSLPAHAQDPQITTARNWSPVSAIPQYQESTMTPYLIADDNRTVHAFASLALSDDPADSASEEIGIFYRQWTVENGWSKPTDVILTPIKRQARVKGVFLDKAGVMHMVFFGGDEQEANLYYTWAPATAADSAHAWVAPLAIGPLAITPDVATITGDGGDNLVVLYSGNLGEGNSLYAIYSDDAGVSWTDPALLYSTYTLDNKAFDLSVAYGATGRVYAVWNVTDKAGQNVAGYYAYMEQLTDQQWSEPKIVAESVGLGFAVPSVFEYQGFVMMIYNNGFGDQIPPIMWFTMSTDGGKSFSEPVRAFPNHIGRNGAASFAVDSSGTLHTFFAQRIPGGFGNNIDLHGMWHSIWSGSSWGPLTAVVSGPPSDSFDPSDANAVVSQGNVVFLTWRTDPGRKIGSTWYTFTTLDTPELPAVALPTPPAGVQAVQDIMLLPTPSPSPPPATEVAGPPPQFSKVPGLTSALNPATPLVNAMVPTLLFIVAALLFGGVRRRRKL